VLLTPETWIDETLGPADVGAEVEVSGIHYPEIPAIEAAVIRVTRNTQETRQWTDVIRSISGSVWVVGDTAVDTAGATIVGVGEVGRIATVHAVRNAGEMWRATEVWVDEPEYVYWSGVIESMAGSIWTVGGRAVDVSDAEITGATPRVGLHAQVQALEEGGQLHAVRVHVVESTPTPTAPPTSTPTAPPSATATPTGTAAPTPTATATPEPTPTDTATLEPTATATPEPTATDTSTPEPTPTDTATPEPTVTDTATLEPVG
jgi:hypothetical protein